MRSKNDTLGMIMKYDRQVSTNGISVGLLFLRLLGQASYCTKNRKKRGTGDSSKRSASRQ
jgi:hypothetical protein